MASINSLSDGELRQQLLKFGVDAPVTATSRGFLIRKLEGLLDAGNSEKQKVNRRKSESTVKSSSGSHRESSTNRIDNDADEMERTLPQPPKNRMSLGINLNSSEISAASIGKKNLLAGKYICFLHFEST